MILKDLRTMKPLHQLWLLKCCFVIRGDICASITKKINTSALYIQCYMCVKFNTVYVDCLIRGKGNEHTFVLI